MKSQNFFQKKRRENLHSFSRYNPTWVSYGTTVAYRRNGAIEASKCGAVASLIKSIGPYSLYTPHTG